MRRVDRLMKTMPKLHSKQVPATVAAVLALSLGACGSEQDRNLLTDGRSTALLDLLDQAEQEFEDDDCDALAGTIEEFQAEVSEISGEVSQDVRDALATEAEDLASLSDECQPPEPAPVPEPEPAPVPEPEPAPEPEPEPQPEPEPEPEPVPPDDGGDDNGDGSGGGDNGSGEGSGDNGSSGENGGTGAGTAGREGAA